MSESIGERIHERPELGSLGARDHVLTFCLQMPVGSIKIDVEHALVLKNSEPLHQHAGGEVCPQRQQP